ncbi:MAG: class I SAM-dependent methyltransferase [Pseudomonadota bacterium]
MAILDDFLKPDITPREIDQNLFSVFDAHEQGAPYDSKAAMYDRLVSSNLYLNIAWGTSRATITSFIQDAFASRQGCILDLAAGTSVDAVDIYATTPRPTIVIDLSIAMLRKGRERLVQQLGHVPANITFLQANALDLPIKTQCVSTVLCHGALHLLPSLDNVLTEWNRVLTTDNTVFASSLVKERWFGNQYLQLLHRAGEISQPMPAAQVKRILSEGLHRPVDVKIEGNFAYGRAE